jgi:hypothetical protein
MSMAANGNGIKVQSSYRQGSRKPWQAARPLLPVSASAGQQWIGFAPETLALGLASRISVQFRMSVGETACVQCCPRRAKPQSKLLPNRKVKNLSLSKRKVMRTDGSQFRHGLCSAAILVLRCTSSRIRPSRRAAATVTPAANVPSRSTFFAGCFTDRTAGRGLLRSWMTAKRNGGSTTSTRRKSADGFWRSRTEREAP